MTVSAASAVLLLAFGLQLAPPPPADVDAGRALFEARRCLSCHMVDGAGARTARDLSWIGLLRPPQKLTASVVNAAVHPDAAALASSDVDKLVAYLRTLRKMWRLEPGPSDREIAPATENAPFFARPDRDTEERPDMILDALALRRGATVADVGSGTGYFTWRLAERVGAAGKVFAVDVQQEMLDRTRATVEQKGLKNVEYVLATERSPRLPEQSVDLVFIAYAYHEFGDPEGMMSAIRRSLKQGGRVVVLEYAKESKIAPASPLHKMSFDEIRREIEPLGFVIDQLFDFLPVQHGVVFTIK